MAYRLHELVECLNDMQDRPDLCCADDPDMFDTNNPDSTVEKALEIADELLITSSGQPNYDAITELKQYGYETYAIERDSFGWLVGGIRKIGTLGPVLAFG